MSESNSDNISEITIAKWSDRFFAWLIDFLIITAISTLIMFAFFGKIDFDMNEKWIWTEAIQYFQTSMIFFGYWITLEYKTGQSIGKRILNLKVTNTYGKKADLKGVIISSFGKTFLIPVDVILGWIFTNEKRQRIFNKIGDTLVVKIKNNEESIENIKYKKD
ncbi:RDD family protein [Nitrosarchaeum koreense]|uniref:Membrane protein n=1 Tax=Nitrosarchaeum koreense MY1 TaxID=1001994 RepID=F9CXC4_9ARCH|nr:RDD family protein [Nitrosarchaeum koreense]EGP93926.1 Membrane protein [Nitrosarchaeum koreense MY1]